MNRIGQRKRDAVIMMQDGRNVCKQYSLEAGAHNQLRLDQRECVKCAGKLSPVHNVSEGNTREFLCVLASYINE